MDSLDLLIVGIILQKLLTFKRVLREFVRDIDIIFSFIRGQADYYLSACEIPRT